MGSVYRKVCRVIGSLIILLYVFHVDRCMQSGDMNPTAPHTAVPPASVFFGSRNSERSTAATLGETGDTMLIGSRSAVSKSSFHRPTVFSLASGLARHRPA